MSTTLQVESKEIQSIITQAQEAYKSEEWPTSADEEWKRSDPSLIPFSDLERSIHTVKEYENDVYVQFQQKIHATIANIDGVEYYPWSDERSRIASAALTQALEDRLDKIDTWRLAQCRAGGVIHVARGTQASQLLHLSLDGQTSEQLDEGEDMQIIAPHIVVIVEDEASFSFGVEVSGTSFFSLGLQVIVGKKAECTVNQLQVSSIDSYNVSTLWAECDVQGEFTNVSGQIGAMMSVDRVHTTAKGTESHIHLKGYYFPSEDQLVDMRSYQKHVAKDTNSRSLYHGVGVDQTHTIYRGLIAVGEEAVETDAYLTNKNILLSEESRMDSIPCLQINTNDVRCSHGATTGTINPDQVFYLKSRGLSDTDAKELLLEGFFRATYSDLFTEMNEKSSRLIREKIRQSI